MLLRLAVLLLLLATFAAHGFAQTPAGEPKPAADPAQPAQAPVVTPPKLKKFVAAEYPPAALAQGWAGSVELELVIGADGLVKEAKVLTPAGNGFDEPALKAALQFEFEPATKDGVAIGARIHYPYIFELQAPAQEEAPAPVPKSRLEGRVLDVQGDAPLAGAEVVIAGTDGAITKRAQSDSKGAFAFEDLPAGGYSLRVQVAGYEPREQQEAVGEGEAVSVVYRLQEPADKEAFGAVARIPPPPRELTRRTIGKEMLTRIPGTRGDALRTVELLPGVARPPLGSGVLIVRGSSPYDTQVLFEGLPVPILYHFGGLTSFINSRMLDSIEFYPGNFSARYGRRRGGTLEVRAADIPRDGVHGVADVNLIDASLLVQAPIGEDFELALAARRSYFDVLFEALVPQDEISTVAAPVYYDYQAMATYRPTSRDKLRLMLFGSSDEFALLFKEPADADSAVSGDFDFSTQFHRAHASWRRALSDDVDQDVDVAVGYVDGDLGLGEAFKFNFAGNDVYGRVEWRARVSEEVRLIGGFDLFFLPGDFTYTGPPVEQTEGNANNNASGATLSNRDQIVAKDAFVVVQPGLYLESDINLQPWRFVIGNRIDYYREIDAFSYDPRLTTHYTVSDEVKLKGGVGLFAQPPQFQESSPKLGNPDLEPTHTLHVGTGIEYTPAEGYELGLEGFYKHLYNRVVGTEFGEAPYLENDGTGRVYGLEVSVRVTPRGRFLGYLSYTLSRSERSDHGGDWQLFDFDQTHMATVSGVYRLGRGWEAGATFRLYSGNLDTPIRGASLDTNTALYSPIFGALNSTRNPTFHRLDVRVEKLWTFSAWKLALYLDVQNVYNATNSEGTIYDYEYRRSESISGLPILPNLGLRGEM